MRASISYLTSTAATAAPLPTVHGAHRLDVLGYHRGEHAVYLREEVGAGVPIVHVVRTRGSMAGRMIAMHSWYEGADRVETADRVQARLEALAVVLAPMAALEHDLWMLTTRVVQRRALRLPEGGRPIRKFALQLSVEPVVATEDSIRARTVVTAYLRPRARLDSVFAVPGEGLAVARVTYVGVPEGIGLDKQVALLVGRDLH